MDTLTLPLAAGPSFAERTAAQLSRLAQRVREWNQRRREEEAFAQLSDATLRDLGMSRSEFGSYWFEAQGLVPQTRRRVRAGGVPPL